MLKRLTAIADLAIDCIEGLTAYQAIGLLAVLFVIGSLLSAMFPSIEVR